MTSMKSFTSEFHSKINARYVTNARIESFISDIHDPVKNKAFSTWLANKMYDVLFTSTDGELRLYDAAFVFLDTENKVIFLYTFLPTVFNGQSAVKDGHIESFKQVKIEGLPIEVYCLFKVLVPRYKIVVSRMWSKDYVDNDVKVYLINEKGTLYNAATHNEVNNIRTEHLWGWDEELRSLLVIYSLSPFSLIDAQINNKILY